MTTKMIRLYLPFFLLLSSCGELTIPIEDEEGEIPGATGGTQHPPTGETPPGGGGAHVPEDGADGSEGTVEDDDTSVAVGFADNGVVLTSDGHLLVEHRLYVSVKEFCNVPSAKYAAVDSAQHIAERYKEGDIDGWRVPTAEDVDVMRRQLAAESFFYGQETMPLLNTVLLEEGLDDFCNCDYLCAGSEYVFSFLFDDEIRKAQKKVYRLRLVSDKRK